MDPEHPTAPRERGRLARAFLAASATVSLVAAAGGAFAYVAYSQAQGAVGTFTTVPESPGQPTHDFGPCVDKVCNYLILGSDSRAGLSPAEQVDFGTNQDIGGSNRSDVIILVHIDPSQEKAVVLSFPRDLWVTIPGQGENKINAAFEGGLNGGGPQRVEHTVENLTGLHINHILYVDLAGFQHIVDVLGGVDMCVPTAMQDILTGLDLQAGCQRLNGYQALAYVRTRHQPCDYIPDFSRIGRQQQFLRSVLNRLLQPSEIVKATSLIKPVAQNLVTDPGFKLADVIYLVKQLEGISTGAVDFRVVPGTTASVTVPWSSIPLSIVKMDPSAEELFRDLRTGKRLPPELGRAFEQTAVSEANVPVLVVDHASVGKASGVEQILSESGFDIAPGTTAYASSGLGGIKGTAIAYAPGHLVDAQVVAKYFPDLPLLEAPKGALVGASVGVLVTSAYQPAPVGSQPPAPTDCQVLNP